MNDNIQVGCSGYAYYEWRDKFYPEGLPSGERLGYYATQFSTVEINSTFYHFPKAATLQKLHDGTPADFQFSVKAGKAITHIKRLKDVSDDVAKFESHVKMHLGSKLRHILFQLPPSFAFSDENLERVLTAIPGNAENVVEFRHVSWWSDEVVNALNKAGITICNVDYPKLPKTFQLTTGRFYMRLHGDPKLFHSEYSEQYIENLVKELPEGLDSYTFYFNNTASNAAWKNARELEEILGHKQNRLL